MADCCYVRPSLWDDGPDHSSFRATLTVYPLKENPRPVGFAPWPQPPKKKRKKKSKQ